MRTLEYTVDAAENGLTAEQFLKQLGLSRNVISLLKSVPGAICADGKPTFGSSRLAAGQHFVLSLPPEAPSQALIPTPMDLDIVYEDRDLLVINKDAGVPVHPSQGNHGNTLAEGVTWLATQRGEPFLFRAVNRLDRDTSGLLIAAKHVISASLLSAMTAAREIHREYLAVALGETDAEGTIDAPIARKEGSVIQREINFQRGERAVTHYQRILYRPEADLSLVRLRLETGRTHQIRVHLSSLGHPLLGDTVYGGRPWPGLAGQCLHARRLSFTHPRTGQRLTLECPLPDWFQAVLTKLEGMV